VRPVYGLPNGNKIEVKYTTQGVLKTIRTHIVCGDIGSVTMVFELMANMKDMV
jgi:hypothetical protein